MPVGTARDHLSNVNSPVVSTRTLCGRDNSKFTAVMQVGCGCKYVCIQMTRLGVDAGDSGSLNMERVGRRVVACR